MTRFLTFLLLGVSTCPAFCQSSELDSLQKRLQEELPALERGQTYYQASRVIGWNDTRALIAYADSALHIADSLNDGPLKFQAYSQKGMGNYVQGRYDRAIKNAIIAHHIADSLGDAETIANASGDLGLMYQAVGKFDEAIALFSESGEYYRSAGKTGELATSVNNLANTYFFQEKYKESLEIRKEALAIRESMANPSPVGDTYNDIGETYFRMGQSDSALYYLHKSYEIKDSVNDIEMMALNCLNLGEVYRSMGQKAKAESYYKQSIQHSREINSKIYLQELYNRLASFYYEEDNMDSAFSYLSAYAEIREELVNEDTQKEIQSLSIEFDTERQKLTIEALEKEAALRDEADALKDLILYISIGALFIALLLAAFLYNRFKVTRQQKNLISEQKSVLQEQKELVEEKNKEIIDSITYAKRLQEAILPPVEVMHKHLPESFVLYLPKDIVAGDFYWMYAANDTVYFAAADCTGHGVPGAMVSVVCHNAMNRAVREFGLNDPAAILNKTRELVIATFEQGNEEVKDGMDIALCSLNRATRELTYAGANNSLYHVQQNELAEIKPDKQPIGYYIDQKPFTNHTLQLKEGDLVYLFSDGYADQFGGPKGKKFKYKQFRELLLSNHIKPMQDQMELLQTAFRNWQGSYEQVDDVCVIGVRV